MTLTGRIWLHGALLFVAVAATLLAARFLLPIPDGIVTVQAHSTPAIVHVVLLIIAAVVLALVLVAMPLARSIARPLERLAELTRALGAGDLGVRAPVDRADEIGLLGQAFNDMAGQIQRLRTAERRLLADVSHELRTPLARIRVVLELAATAELAKVQRYHAEIATDLSELEQLLDDIIVSSRLDPDAPRWDEARPPLHLEPLAIGQVVATAADRFRARWPGRTPVGPDAGPALATEIAADPVILRRALDNLLDNARKYSADDTPIELQVSGTLDQVRVEVIDRGAGIAPGDQPGLFSPFFRADPSRDRATGGVGLGLALARRIVEAHAGAIGFISELGRGSCFYFTLPAAGTLPASSRASSLSGKSATT